MYEYRGKWKIEVGVNPCIGTHMLMLNVSNNGAYGVYITFQRQTKGHFYFCNKKIVLPKFIHAG